MTPKTIEGILSECYWRDHKKDKVILARAKSEILELVKGKAEKLRVPYLHGDGHPCSSCDRASVRNDTIDDMLKTLEEL